MTTAITAPRTGDYRWAKDTTGRWWELRRGEPYTLATETNCARCGGVFLTRPSEPKTFCSHSCAQKNKPVRENSPKWKGGRSRDREGYVWLNVGPEYPGAVRRGHIWVIKEHRKVMAEVLGRPLTRRENVHHLNGVKDDNRPENLELWVTSQPSGVRAVDVPHCPTCTCNGSYP